MQSLKSVIDNVEPFDLLDEDTHPNVNSPKKNFSDLEVITPPISHIISTLKPVRFSSIIHKTCQSKQIKETSTTRENLVLMVRMQDMKRRMWMMEEADGTMETEISKKNKKKRLSHIPPLSSLVLQSMDSGSPRCIPPANSISSSQARKQIKECSALASLHNGFEKIGTMELDTLTDVAIHFLLKLGRTILHESDKASLRASRDMTTISYLSDTINLKENSTSKKDKKSKAKNSTNTSNGGNTKIKSLKQQKIEKSVDENDSSRKNTTKKSNMPNRLKISKEKNPFNSSMLLVIENALRRTGCCITDLEAHLTREVRYGDQLRILDRKMLKKGSKGKTTSDKSASIPESENELNLAMKEALASAPLGVPFMCNVMRSTGREVVIPNPPVYIFKKKEKKAKVSEIHSIKDDVVPSVVESLVPNVKIEEQEISNVSSKNIENTEQSEATKKENIGNNKDNTNIDEDLMSLPADILSADLELDGLGELDDGTPMKIEHLDLALAQTNKSKTQGTNGETDVIGLDADLDLSNLDDLFDGETMLGDDMLPTTF